MRPSIPIGARRPHAFGKRLTTFRAAAAPMLDARRMQRITPCG
jgi:hypothetical protein